MTTLNFSDAIAELVRQFPTVDAYDRDLAMRRFRRLTVVADKMPPMQGPQPEEIDWFDNFPV